jgi:hypothetical protein
MFILFVKSEKRCLSLFILFGCSVVKILSKVYAWSSGLLYLLLFPAVVKILFSNSTSYYSYIAYWDKSKLFSEFITVHFELYYYLLENLSLFTKFELFTDTELELWDSFSFYPFS